MQKSEQHGSGLGNWSRSTVRGAGLVVACLVMCLLLLHSMRAAASALFYHSVKYGRYAEAEPPCFATAEWAHKAYPHNYHLCVWAGETAFYTAGRVDAEESDRRYMLAAQWAMRGLQLNPYSSQLQLLHARMLAREDPCAAAESWREYVDWHYWEPFNHAVLAEFEAECGWFERAAESLLRAQRSSHYPAAKAAVMTAWRQAMQPPEIK